MEEESSEVQDGDREYHKFLSFWPEWKRTFSIQNKKNTSMLDKISEDLSNAYLKLANLKSIISIIDGKLYEVEQEIEENQRRLSALEKLHRLCLIIFSTFDIAEAHQEYLRMGHFSRDTYNAIHDELQQIAPTLARSGFKYPYPYDFREALNNLMTEYYKEKD